MKKHISTIIALISFAFTLQAQNVNIPDDNFKTYLLNNVQINTDANKTEISIAEAIAFSGIIYANDHFINSLVGIEAFINLTGLYCSTNYLTSLDVTKNTKLTNLQCSYNQLTSLDVSKNTALVDLNCTHNQLTSLNLTNNTSLSTLNCNINRILSLDVTKNIDLTVLECSSNQLKNLDLTKNTVLTGLYCSGNYIVSLEISKNTSLTVLECITNQLPYLDVTKNTVLTKLMCGGNQLTSLDVTKNTVLEYFDSGYNPNLTCIQALNSQNKTNWSKDDIAQYNENCNIVQGVNEEKLTQSKTIQNIYNLQGQVVNTNYQGLVIIRYTDGTSEKTIL